MAAERKIEIFSAGCPVCEETVKLVNDIACPSCAVTALDMKDPAVAERARRLGVHSIPAVAINGTLADCCAGRGPDEATLRAAGVGRRIAQPLKQGERYRCPNDECGCEIEVVQGARECPAEHPQPPTCCCGCEMVKAD